MLQRRPRFLAEQLTTLIVAFSHKHTRLPIPYLKGERCPVFHGARSMDNPLLRPWGFCGAFIQLASCWCFCVTAAIPTFVRFGFNGENREGRVQLAQAQKLNLLIKLLRRALSQPVQGGADGVLIGAYR